PITHTPLLVFHPPTAPPDLYTLSLHDALPILGRLRPERPVGRHAAEVGVHRQPPGLHRRLNVGLAHHGIHRVGAVPVLRQHDVEDRKSTRLNSSHVSISYAVFCLKKKTHNLTL